MKLLHEASLVFQVHQLEDGNLILDATLVAEDIKPDSTSASAASIAAAAALALFNEGVVHERASSLFNVNLGVKKDGAAAGNGSTSEGGTDRPA